MPAIRHIIQVTSVFVGLGALAIPGVHGQAPDAPTASCVSPQPAGEPRHYIFFNRARGRIRDSAFLANPGIEGAQVKYTWAELEPEKDRYDFSAIREDQAFLAARGKRLFVQLQDVSFDSSIVNVPRYLMTEPEFNGGATRDYHQPRDDEAQAVPAGWVARRWDPAVQARMHRLFAALGAQLDGRIAGINLPETSVGFGTSGRLWPRGYTPERYRDAVIENMRALKRAFPVSVAMQYGNFMPAEWLPGNDRGYLRSVYAAARVSGVAMGGPDLFPYQRGHMNHNYPLIRAHHGAAPTGIAVQEGNYGVINPRTGKPPAVVELIEFARDYLCVDYVFWFAEEPYYSRDVFPTLRRRVQESPRFFAPGVVTIPEATTYRPTFSPDGRTAIYSMEVSGGYVLVETRMRGGRWDAPEVLPFSGRYSDAEGVLSPDGTRFVFASQRPREGTAPRTDYDLWEVTRDPGGRWGTPRLMEGLATPGHELYPSLTRDGTLYFTRSSPDGSDLWRAAAGYAAPEPVRELNTDRRESGGFVDAEGTVLLFGSNREGTLGGLDLFVSCREGGAWGAARPLPAPINSADQENSPTLSPDGKTLYFTSNRRSPDAARLGDGARYGDLLRRLREPGNGLWHTYQIATPALCRRPAP
ncbi:MAG TPA: hypothetical protein VF647_24390 [Longimicrobium sp.]|jgi:hypothetical protein